ncbi:hypothetical protein AV530_018195 [Patagioenas fasciata monilis]|nr:hypothetical protein AV530_018195 [Patagioenas fasciata monilis]
MHEALLPLSRKEPLCIWKKDIKCALKAQKPKLLCSRSVSLPRQDPLCLHTCGILDFNSHAWTFPEFVSKAEMCMRGRWAEVQRGNNLPWSSSPKTDGVVTAAPSLCSRSVLERGAAGRADGGSAAVLLVLAPPSEQSRLPGSAGAGVLLCRNCSTGLITKQNLLQ